VFVVLSGGLWLVTQAGMDTCEIEIIEVSRLSFEGPDGSFDNFGFYQAVIRYRVIRPVGDPPKKVNLFFHFASKLGKPPNLTADAEEPAGDVKSIDSAKVMEGGRVVFRYRKQDVLWMKADNLREMTIRKLGFNPDDIEEVITDYYLESPTQNSDSNS
jgi:hypothetical protein